MDAESSNTSLQLQVQALRQVILKNARLLANESEGADVPSGDVFVHVDFFPNIVTLLENVVRDSITIHTTHDANRTLSAMDTKFLKRQIMNTMTAVADTTALEEPNAGDAGRELQTMRRKFALDLLESVIDTFRENLAATTERPLELQSLSALSVDGIGRLLESLSLATRAYADQRDDSFFFMQGQDKVQDALDHAKVKIGDLKLRTSTLQQENDELKEAANRSATSTQQMTKEIESLRVASTELERKLLDKEQAAKKMQEKLDERDSELASLRSTLASRDESRSTSSTSRSTQPAGLSPSMRRTSANGQQLSMSSSTSKRKAEWISALDLGAWGLPLPPRRTAELAALPEVEVKLPDGQDELPVIELDTLRPVLGGKRRSIFVRTESYSGLMRNEYEYLQVNMDHQPWAPTGPGKHGYVIIGLGNEQSLITWQMSMHLIVGHGKQFQYCGSYELVRTEPLTREEWAMLPSTVKKTQIDKAMKEPWAKEKTGAELVEAYVSGARQLPCALLQCVEFNTAFYKKLIRARNDEWYPYITWTRPQKRHKSASSNDRGIGTSQVPPSGSVSSSAAPSKEHGASDGGEVEEGEDGVEGSDGEKAEDDEKGKDGEHLDEDGERPADELKGEDSGEEGEEGEDSKDEGNVEGGGERHNIDDMYAD